MNLRFWKRKKLAVEIEGEENLPEPSDRETATGAPEAGEEKPDFGKLARFKSRLAAIIKLFRKRSKPAENDLPTADESPPTRPRAAETDEKTEEAISATKSKKRLLLLGALGMLVLLLTGAGFAVWKWLLAPMLQKEAAKPHEISVQAGNPAPSAGTEMQAQIEALRKQNQAMQAQIEALKKEGIQEKPAVAEAPNDRSTGKAAPPPPGEGVLIISGKDTKASVQSLKQVIEEMNASSGENNGRKR